MQQVCARAPQEMLVGAARSWTACCDCATADMVTAVMRSAEADAAEGVHGGDVRARRIWTVWVPRTAPTGCACRGQRYRFLARREASAAIGSGKGCRHTW